MQTFCRDALINGLLSEFQSLFGADGDIRIYFAPGRVNLIGEHTDYNGGHVFPCALTLGIYGAARRRSDRTLRFYSMNFKSAGVIESDLDRLSTGSGQGWTAYPEGVIRALRERGIKLPCGLDLVITGNLPDGAGLSASAALEVLTAVILRDLFDLSELSMIDAALLGQQAENQYVGVNCGIMDQFASAMGKAGHAIFLDTNTLDYRHVPLDLQDAVILIANSRVKHSLVGSVYNDRRLECAQALAELQKTLPVRTLGDLSEAEFLACQDRITDPVCRRRARHAVTENQRTLRAAEALTAGDLACFGQLMNESHDSLRDDYEVSCPEIDTLVELARSVPGVFGSRLTGGGFGGCTVSIVKSEAVPRFIEAVGSGYEQATGIRAEFYPVQCGAGAGRIAE